MSFSLAGKAVKQLRLSTVDYTNTPIVTIPAQQGDVNSRYLEVTLYDDRGNLALSSDIYPNVKLNGTTFDGKHLTSEECEISSDGTIIVEFGGEFAEIPDKVMCDITLKNETANVSLTTRTFYVFVSKSQGSENAQ